MCITVPNTLKFGIIVQISNTILLIQKAIIKLRHRVNKTPQILIFDR